jgi:hypothetical protein
VAAEDVHGRYMAARALRVGKCSCACFECWFRRSSGETRHCLRPYAGCEEKGPTRANGRRPPL